MRWQAAAPPTIQRSDSETEGEASDIESLLWTCKECYVYQIPPLKNENGHRANDWDVNKWLWSGALKLTATGTLLKIILHDPTTGALFATCPMAAAGNKAIDQVIDSSRYFAIRIDDGKGKHAFVGLGFRDRSEAYDFNATMQDHWKGVRRAVEAKEEAKAFAERVANEPMRDLSLKDGETLSIKVNVPGASSKPRAPKPKAADGGAGTFSLPPPPGKPGLLAPPPKAGAIAPPPPAPVAPPAAAAAPTAAPAAAAEDDGFGDFTSTAEGGADDDDFGDFQ